MADEAILRIVIVDGGASESDRSGGVAPEPGDAATNWWADEPAIAPIDNLNSAIDALTADVSRAANTFRQIPRALASQPLTQVQSAPQTQIQPIAPQTQIQPIPAAPVAPVAPATPVAPVAPVVPATPASIYSQLRELSTVGHAEPPRLQELAELRSRGTVQSDELAELANLEDLQRSSGVQPEELENIFTSAKITARERQFLEAALVQGLRAPDIAKEFGINRSRVYQLATQVTKKLGLPYSLTDVLKEREAEGRERAREEQTKAGKNVDFDEQDTPKGRYSKVPGVDKLMRRFAGIYTREADKASPDLEKLEQYKAVVEALHSGNIDKDTIRAAVKSKDLQKTIALLTGGEHLAEGGDIPAAFGTPSPVFPEPPKLWTPDMMDMYPKDALRATYTKTTNADLARAVADYVHKYSLAPKNVYKRVLENIGNRLPEGDISEFLPSVHSATEMARDFSPTYPEAKHFAEGGGFVDEPLGYRPPMHPLEGIAAALKSGFIELDGGEWWAGVYTPWAVAGNSPEEAWELYVKDWYDRNIHNNKNFAEGGIPDEPTEVVIPEVYSKPAIQTEGFQRRHWPESTGTFTEGGEDWPAGAWNIPVKGKHFAEGGEVYEDIIKSHFPDLAPSVLKGFDSYSHNRFTYFKQYPGPPGEYADKDFVKIDFRFLEPPEHGESIGQRGYVEQNAIPDKDSFAFSRTLMALAKDLKAAGIGIIAEGTNDKRNNLYNKMLARIGMEEILPRVFYESGGQVDSGLKHFAKGGRTDMSRGGQMPHTGMAESGQDWHPAWLTDKEFVINAKSSARNREALQVANANPNVTLEAKHYAAGTPSIPRLAQTARSAIVTTGLSSPVGPTGPQQPTVSQSTMDMLGLIGGPVGQAAVLAIQLVNAAHTALRETLVGATRSVGLFAQALTDPDANPAKLFDRAGDTITAGGEKFSNAIAFAASPVTSALGIDLVPQVKIATAVVSETAKQFSVLMDSIKATSERYGQYSPDIAIAEAMVEVRHTMGDLRRAQEIGPQLHQYLRAQGELQQRIEDIKVRFMAKIVPLVTQIVNIVEKVMPVGDGIVNVLSSVIVPMTAMLEALNRIAGAQEDANRPEIHDPTTILFEEPGQGPVFGGVRLPNE